MLDRAAREAREGGVQARARAAIGAADIEHGQLERVVDGPLDGAVAHRAAPEGLEGERGRQRVEHGGERDEIDAGARVHGVDALIREHRDVGEPLHEPRAVGLGEEQPRRVRGQRPPGIAARGAGRERGLLVVAQPRGDPGQPAPASASGGTAIATSGDSSGAIAIAVGAPLNGDRTTGASARGSSRSARACARRT